MAQARRLAEQSATWSLGSNAEGNLDQVIGDYLTGVATLPGEAARSRCFAAFLEQVLGLHTPFLEDCVADAERFLRVQKKDRVVRGSADELFGNVILEFESDLSQPRRQEEARVQLRRYLACLWSQEPADQRRHYLCLATDGVRFHLYTPWAPEPHRETIVPGEISLKRADQLNAAELQPPQQLLNWLDRYLCRREPLLPTGQSFALDFGAQSHACQVVTRELWLLWQRLATRPDCHAMFECWRKHLEMSCAGHPATPELYVHHTYLALLARLIAWRRLAGRTTLPDADALRSALSGVYFRTQGLPNLFQSDLFTWPLRAEVDSIAVVMARSLAGLLQAYDLAEPAIAGLKTLYEQLADLSPNHRSAPETTPAWLASRILERALADRIQAVVVDPCCGSGTFLCQVVLHKRRDMGDSATTLTHLQESVVGLDPHPLAALVAQTSYLLALGGLLDMRRQSLLIPVYLANALRPPELVQRGRRKGCGPRTPSYMVDLAGQSLLLPKTLLDEAAHCDEAVDAAWAFAALWPGSGTAEDFAAYLRTNHPAVIRAASSVAALFALAEAFRRLALGRLDAPWPGLAKDSLRAILLTDHADLLAGAPPRSTPARSATPEYQRLLTSEVTPLPRQVLRNADAAPGMEHGAWFVLRAARLYLKDGGTVACVLPLSVLRADLGQAEHERASRAGRVLWSEIWDLAGVEPLSRAPTCVLFGKKATAADEQQAVELPGQILSGSLSHREASPAEAEKALHTRETRYYLERRGNLSRWTTLRAVQATLEFC